jgi:2,2-dialkylglycine decarboxylase (pyruvate)
MPNPTLTNEPWDEHLIRYGMPFAPHLIVKARGTLIWDSEGRELLDFTSGQMCATIGHNHPRIVEAMAKACAGALHLFSGMLSPPVVELSRRLAAMLPPSLCKAMFLSTGGEANEAALKLAKMYSGKFEVVGFTGAWHGMTSGAQSVNYFAGRKGYGPMMPGSLMLPVPNSYRCPIRHCRDACDGTCLEVGFNLVDAQSTGSLAALIAEPVERRRRHRATGGLLAAGRAALRIPRHAAHLRRGADRLPVGARFCLPAFRRRA